MDFSDVELPSNKKFGIFFTIIFFVSAGYFILSSLLLWAFIFATAALVFLLTTTFKAEALLPLNKIWMYLALLLAKIISPFVLGIVFFGLLTPIGLIMRLIGRDELSLKPNKKNSYWRKRNDQIQEESFKNQF